MRSQQKPKSNKLDSLPKDLRAIADELIAKKFPEESEDNPYIFSIGVDPALNEDEIYFSTWRKNYEASFTVEMMPDSADVLRSIISVTAV